MTANQKRHSPATARNRDAILSVMQSQLGERVRVIEVASGSGEHAAYIAPRLKTALWQPTDVTLDNLISIDLWREESTCAAIAKAQAFDVVQDNFIDLGHENIDVIMAANLIHIAPFMVMEALIKKAGAFLHSGAALYLYGPFKRDGKHSAPSNAAFDADLRNRNPEWGIRDLEDVEACAEKASFLPTSITAMPANNLSLIFRKR